MRKTNILIMLIPILLSCETGKVNIKPSPSQSVSVSPSVNSPSASPSNTSTPKASVPPTQSPSTIATISPSPIINESPKPSITPSSTPEPSSSPEQKGNITSFRLNKSVDVKPYTGNVVIMIDNETIKHIEFYYLDSEEEKIIKNLKRRQILFKSSYEAMNESEKLKYKDIPIYDDKKAEPIESPVYEIKYPNGGVDSTGSNIRSRRIDGETYYKGYVGAFTQIPYEQILKMSGNEAKDNITFIRPNEFAVIFEPPDESKKLKQILDYTNGELFYSVANIDIIVFDFYHKPKVDLSKLYSNLKILNSYFTEQPITFISFSSVRTMETYAIAIDVLVNKLTPFSGFTPVPFLYD